MRSEPYAGKLARTVPRGGQVSNDLRPYPTLSGKTALGRGRGSSVRHAGHAAVPVRHRHCAAQAAVPRRPVRHGPARGLMQAGARIRINIYKRRSGDGTSFLSVESVGRGCHRGTGRVRQG
ncbi:hypothetical protein CBM2626_A10024 [Cupriavidus taiwanensis]|nr:hypothetical protein CBM2626_A10024 [Cupriavidus taiwanensis]